MDTHYHTLICLYRIVAGEPRPLNYPCAPRDLILRLEQDWQQTEAALRQLGSEGLVAQKTFGTPVFTITQSGWEKAESLIKMHQERAAV